MSFSIRLTDEEQALAQSYARLHAVSLGEAFKAALFEKIDDEFDLSIAGEALREYEEGGKRRRPFADLRKELDL